MTAYAEANAKIAALLGPARQRQTLLVGRCHDAGPFRALRDTAGFNRQFWTRDGCDLVRLERFDDLRRQIVEIGLARHAQGLEAFRVSFKEAQRFVEENLEEIGRCIFSDLQAATGRALDLEQYAIANPLVLPSYPAQPHNDINWHALRREDGFQIWILLSNETPRTGNLRLVSCELDNRCYETPVSLRLSPAEDSLQVLENNDRPEADTRVLQELAFKDVRLSYVDAVAGEAFVFNRTVIHYPCVALDMANKRLALSIRFVPRDNFATRESSPAWFQSFPPVPNPGPSGSSRVLHPTRARFRVVGHSVLATDNSQVTTDFEIADFRLEYE